MGTEDRSHTEVVADQLLDMYFEPDAKEMQHIGSYELPSDEQGEHVLDLARGLMFPGYAGPDVHRGARQELRDLVRVRVADMRAALQRQVYRAMHHKRQQVLGRSDLECADCTRRANAIADRFLEHLPELRRQIRIDLH